MTRETEDDIERVRYLLLAAQREGNRRLAAGLAPLGLSPSQAEVLRLLAEHEPLTLTGLGELLVCESGTNPSRLVARLVDAGLVEKLPVTNDARQIALSLTPRGRDCQLQALPVERDLHAHLRHALEGVDLEAFAAALQAMVQGTCAGDAIARRTFTATGIPA